MQDDLTALHHLLTGVLHVFLINDKKVDVAEANFDDRMS